MIIASWKCVAVEQPAAQAISKKQKSAPKINPLHIDTLRMMHVDVVFGFRNNGSLIINWDGIYETRPYKVEGNILTLTRFAPMHTSVYTTYTILELNYRTMAWQDKDGFVYRFERE